VTPTLKRESLAWSPSLATAMGAATKGRNLAIAYGRIVRHVLVTDNDASCQASQTIGAVETHVNILTRA
jgi:hypothetical protein